MNDLEAWNDEALGFFEEGRPKKKKKKKKKKQPEQERKQEKQEKRTKQQHQHHQQQQRQQQQQQHFSTKWVAYSSVPIGRSVLDPSGSDLIFWQLGVCARTPIF